MTAPAIDLERPWALDDRVALRPESFGALAYHFGTRRLSFLKHPTLVRLVESLASHPTAGAAVESVAANASERAALTRALAMLAESDTIVERAA